MSLPDWHEEPISKKHERQALETCTRRSTEERVKVVV